jgi:TM2 domain-containing membrane protein YozV
MAKIIDVLPEVRGEEMFYIQSIVKDMPDDRAKTFATVYRTRRKEPQLILVLTLLGFIGFAGLHRMLTNQVGLGILYFFTVGLCFIGTIIDLVNSEKLAFEYNRKMADESLVMIG